MTVATQELAQPEITFELCAETLDACKAANEGGADRIELCVNLQLDGTTPPPEMIARAVELSHLPVHILLRPVADDFVYNAQTFAVIREDLLQAKQLGAAGVIAGVLNPDRTVAVGAMQELVALASPLPLEFHRAFDRTPNLAQALEDVIASGCARVLTSGGAPDVIAGARQLTELVAQAGQRVEIAAGGGLRTGNAGTLAALWAGLHFHGSLGGAADGVAALRERIRHTIELLHGRG